MNGSTALPALVSALNSKVLEISNIESSLESYSLNVKTSPLLSLTIVKKNIYEPISAPGGTSPSTSSTASATPRTSSPEKAAKISPSSPKFSPSE